MRCSPYLQCKAELCYVYGQNGLQLTYNNSRISLNPTRNKIEQGIRGLKIKLNWHQRIQEPRRMKQNVLHLQINAFFLRQNPANSLLNDQQDKRRIDKRCHEILQQSASFQQLPELSQHIQKGENSIQLLLLKHQALC